MRTTLCATNRNRVSKVVSPSKFPTLWAEMEELAASLGKQRRVDKRPRSRFLRLLGEQLEARQLLVHDLGFMQLEGNTDTSLQSNPPATHDADQVYADF